MQVTLLPTHGSKIRDSTEFSTEVTVIVKQVVCITQALIGKKVNMDYESEEMYVRGAQ